MNCNQKLKLGVVLCWIVSLTCIEVEGATSLVLFKRITTLEGLPQNTVNAILEDHYGFMWIGTQDGLCRFDGYDIKIFRNHIGDSSSISNNYILSLFEDRDGTLWVGTRGGGLNRFDRKSDTFTRWDLTSKGLINRTANGVTCLEEDGSGNLWVGTYEGLVVLDPTRESTLQLNQDPKKEGQLSNLAITSLLKDRSGSIWVGTQNGLNRWIPEPQSFVVYLNDPEDNETLSSDKVRRLFEDGSGRIWVGTSRGLNQFHPQKNSFTSFQSEKEQSNTLSSDFISSIAQDSKGAFWVATDDAGLNYKKQHSTDWERITHDPNNDMSLSGQNITCVYIDSRNLLWAGTSFGGVNITDLNPKPFFYIGKAGFNRAALSNTNVLSILKDRQGIIWVGTVNGLNAIKLEENRCTYYYNHPKDPKSISGNQVVSIFEDSKGILWFGTARHGVNRFNRSTGEFERFQHQEGNPASLTYNGVYSIFEDHSGVMWFGTLGGGLEEFDPLAGSFIHHRTKKDDPKSISVDSIYTIYEDRNQNLLLGMYGGGLDILSQDRKSIRHMRRGDSQNSLASDFVMSILEDQRGRFWLGTTSGLHLVDLKEEVVLRHWTEDQGLPNNTIYSVQEDQNGFLWCSTNMGLCKVEPETGEVITYDHTEGLQDNEFNFGAHAKDSSGMMYFGGIGGISYFNPMEIVDDERPPQTRLTEFLLLNRPVSPQPQTSLEESISMASEVHLSYSDYVFGFEFAALNFRYPEKSQFKYRLEGFDSNWITTDAKNRRATYTNIPPGHYTFRVQASNHDGFWNKEGAWVHVTISPPPWKTWWAYLIYGVLLFLLSAAIVQSQRQKMRQKQHELNLEKAFSQKLEAEVKERTQQVIHQKEQLEMANRKLTELATQDELTGIANVRLFREFLFFEWKRAIREKQPISLIMMDVDYFKNYNDTYGHPQGDKCLKTIGGVLKEVNQRTTDLAARYGGEEFVFVLINTDIKGAVNVAERIRSQVHKKKIPHQNSPVSSYVTVSLGVATGMPHWDESYIESPDDLIKLADEALYRSKKSGRNQVSFSPIRTSGDI